MNMWQCLSESRACGSLTACDVSPVDLCLCNKTSIRDQREWCEFTRWLGTYGSLDLVLDVSHTASTAQVRLMRMRSAYAGALSRSDSQNYILVCCDLECKGVAQFLQEFFHDDHGVQNTRICLLVPGEPSAVFRDFLLRYKTVRFLKGDAMVRKILQKMPPVSTLLADR